jgi:transcriptional regulator NrdR family protein
MTTRKRLKRTRPRGGASLTCDCKHKASTRVLETRRAANGRYVMRKRRCKSCKKVFVTREQRVGR